MHLSMPCCVQRGNNELRRNGKGRVDGDLNLHLLQLTASLPCKQARPWFANNRYLTRVGLYANRSCTRVGLYRTT